MITVHSLTITPLLSKWTLKKIILLKQSEILKFDIAIRNRQSGNTGRLNRNLYVMLKFTERPKTPAMTSKKTLLSLKGISRSCANLDETKSDMVQFTKRCN